jgi:N,N'-diacetyllegionaminate synthase
VTAIRIGNRTIGDNYPAFIIAEAGVNHNGDIHLALRLVDAAVEAGVDAVKFQTFVTEEIVTRTAEKADYQKENTGSTHESQFEMLKKLELSFDAFREIKSYCEYKGILFLSTPFDHTSVDFLDDLKIAAFKIPSGELINRPLLRHIALKRKPVILSTGMASLEEVESAVSILRTAPNPKTIILHCTSEYPARAENINLRVMGILRDRFLVPVGLSDHSPGIAIALAAVALGASVLEKHFTLDKNLAGPDHRASLETHELKELVKGIRTIEKALGNGVKAPSGAEKKTRCIVRKSIVAAVDIKKGTVLREDNLTTKRPGNGLSPMRWNEVIGTKAVRDFKADELITM